MKLSSSVSLSLVIGIASAALRASPISRKLSYETIGLGYTPNSKVTDHNAIDLDQKAMEEQLALGTSDSYSLAKKLFQEGAHSESYAEVKLLTALPAAVQGEAEIIGTNAAGKEVRGTALESAEIGATTLKIQYATTEMQASYVGCQVGALEVVGNMAGCFNATGALQIDGIGRTLSYNYNVSQDNNNDRTLAGFSTSAQKKMFDCPNCPYADYLKFRNYYDVFDYGNQWVLAAFSGGQTSFKNGNANFGEYGFSGRSEAIKKGSAHMIVWMYVIRELEDALDDCQQGCIDCNDDPVHAWDEGVAFYTGSQQGTDGLTSGYLVYTLANKRCENFKTCGDNGDMLEGESKVNSDIFQLFKIGQQNLLNGKCTEARTQKEDIAKLMAVPLVQGTLRYAYLTSSIQTNVEEKSKAEAAVFAASVLPIVHHCNAADAQTIYDNMGVGSASADFAAVKKAFENNYACMGITCSDVGGLYDETTSTYYSGMSPCLDGSGNTSSSSSSSTNTGLIVGLTFGLVALLGIFLFWFQRKRKREGVDNHHNKFSSDPEGPAPAPVA